MAESVGSIYYTVEADTQKLLDSVRPTDASLDKLNKQFGRTDAAAKRTEFQMTKTAEAVQGLGRTSTSLSALDKAFIGLAAAAGGAALALAKIALSTTKTIDETSKFADQIGTTTEALTGLRFSAQQFANVSDQQFNMALRRMTRRIAEAAEGGGAASNTFKDLGVDIRALARMSPDKQFLAFADAIKRTDDQGKRLQYTMSLFDTEGMPLVNALQQGSIELERNIELAQRFGVVLDTDTAKAAESLMTSLGQLRAVKEGLSTEVASRLIPTFADWTGSLVEATAGTVNMEKIVDGAFNAITVASVAAAAGLTRYTASLALAGAQSVINATKAQVSAAAELRAARAHEQTTRAALAQVTAMRSLGATQAQVTAATNAQAAAQARLAAAQTAAGVAARGLLGVLGGPAGLAITAGLTAAAILGIRNRATEAKVPVDLLAESVKELNTATLEFRAIQLQEKIDEMSDLGAEVSKNGARMEYLKRQLEQFPNSREAAGWAREIAELNSKVANGKTEIAAYRDRLNEVNAALAERSRLEKEGAGQQEETKREVDPYVTALQRQKDLLEVTGAQRAKLAAIQRLGADATEDDRIEAKRLAEEIYNLEEAQRKANSTASKGIDHAKQNQDAIARLSDEVRLATLEGLELAEARALQALNEFATEPEIARVKELSRALHEANEIAARRSRFGTGEDADKYILGDPQPLSGGMFDDQYARYEAEAEIERKRYAEVLENLKEAREVQAKTNRSYDELEQQAAQDHADRMAQIEQAKAQVMLSSASGAFGALADVMKQSQGEQSAIYKAMFAASKAFAIAEAIVKIQQGIANAAALPFPANIPAMAQVAAATASIVSTISSASMGGGRQYGGPVGAGKMYRINENGAPEVYNAANGQQFLLPNSRGQVVSNKEATKGDGAPAPRVTVNLIEDASRGGQVEQTAGDEKEEIINVFVANIRGGGRAADAIETTYGVRRLGR